MNMKVVLIASVVLLVSVYSANAVSVKDDDAFMMTDNTDLQGMKNFWISFTSHSAESIMCSFATNPNLSNNSRNITCYHSGWGNTYTDLVRHPGRSLLSLVAANDEPDPD
ncbi:hypothetical protein Pcinc_034162 [Petrolisthes cinctipes]|uniref:Uncharacterized protein n=1 Tax=Petrolisthes cinctipes TaxID=88211 RepID=A0AAE1EQV7_PETCI|nr:hypothetical protein Pcinc_034162 [Petrolisthes cinctipes]